VVTVRSETRDQFGEVVQLLVAKSDKRRESHG
jgi:hypothetical protein